LLISMLMVSLAITGAESDAEMRLATKIVFLNMFIVYPYLFFF